MNDEFAARKVARAVLAHLERRRPDIVGDDAALRREMERALAPLREAYRDSALPPAYFAALEQELAEAVPGRWRAAASSFTAAENRSFGSWRGGDIYARVVYVFIGLVVGGLCVKLPFIPIWEKWFPFVLAIAAWWLPTAQLAWHRRRYARALGSIALKVASSQPRLDGTFTTDDLLLPPKGES